MIINGITHANWRDRQTVIELKNGNMLAYQEAGNTEGKPLILLHGFGNSGRNWKYTFQFLENDYHIYAVDEMGAGLSSCPDAFAFTITEQAENVIELMNALGIEKVLLAGHSIGSFICQAIGFMVPERVEKMVLVSTFARLSEKPEDIAKAAKRYDAIMEDRPNEYWYSERANYADKEGFEYQMTDLLALPEAYFKATWWGMTMTDHRNFLQFITSPVMVVWGGTDQGIPENLRDEFVRYMPDVEVHTYKELGHEIVSRAPEQLCSDMKKFFQE